MNIFKQCAVLTAILVLLSSCGRGAPEPSASTTARPPSTVPPAATEATTEPAPDIVTETDETGDEYYTGSLHDLLTAARQSGSERLCVLEETENYIVINVSKGEAAHYRCAVFVGGDVLFDELAFGAAPVFTYVGERGLRLETESGSDTAALRYFDLETGAVSREIEYTGVVDDIYDAELGLVAVYSAFGGRLNPTLLVEQISTGYIMEIPHYLRGHTSCAQGAELLSAERLALEYSAPGGTVVTELVDIDFTPPFSRREDEGQAGNYDIPTRWQTQGSLEWEADRIRDWTAGFDFALEYDYEAGQYCVLESMVSGVAECWTVTNHSVTIGVRREMQLEVDRYPGPSVKINERVFRFYEGTRYHSSQYFFSDYFEYTADDDYNYITVYFSRDFDLGEIEYLGFVWGKLD